MKTKYDRFDVEFKDRMFKYINMGDPAHSISIKGDYVSPEAFEYIKDLPLGFTIQFTLTDRDLTATFVTMRVH